MDVQAEPTAGGPGGASSGDKMDDGTKKEEEEQENDGDVCALFAMSTPRDIWANPSLAALAALIDEDEDQKEESIEAEQGKTLNGAVVLLLCTVDRDDSRLPPFLVQGCRWCPERCCILESSPPDHNKGTMFDIN